MSALTERGHGIVTVRQVRTAASADAAHSVIAGAIPPIVASILTRDAFEKIRRGLITTGDIPARR